MHGQADGYFISASCILNNSSAMLPVKWIRCVFFPVLLFSSHQYPGTYSSGNKSKTVFKS